VTVRGRHVLLALTIVHPVPSAINAGLVAVIAGIAGAEPPTAALLATAMLGFQFSIGALNDVVDAEPDRRHKLRKPIPAGLVPVWLALVLAGLGAAIGLGISASLGGAVLVLGVLGYATGVAYDLVLRRLGLGWLAFAAAFPLLLAWTWVGAAGVAPPGWPLLLSVAALAGPTIHLANSLADVDADEQVGRRSLATRLGPRRSRRVLAALMGTVLVLAWITMLWAAPASNLAIGVASVASVTAVVGVTLSWRLDPRARETGWLLQAVGLAGMATAWLASTAGA
jgi:1,4-dihydroxy-2-naphthoate polyprenyltransferase